ncbi:MAG: AsmA family protein [Gammaproteobacteria bacterium]|nr:AsmA family protein [Gammaproteobacteria bacterium]
MRKPFRIAIGLLLVLVLLVAGGAAYVLLVLDPNALKPRIVDLAGKQGIGLEIQGDLAWQLFPSPGVRIGRTRVRATDHRIPELSFERAALSLDWRGLLHGTPKISALSVQGADIKIATATQAVVAAAAPLAAAAVSSDTTPATTDAGKAPTTIAISAVDITQSRVTLTGAGAPRVLDNLDFSSRDMVLDGKPFPVRIAFDYTDSALPMPLGIAVEADLGVDQTARMVATDNVHLHVTPVGRAVIDAYFALRFEQIRDRLAISALRISSGALAAEGDLTVSELSTLPAVRGQLRVPPADPRPLLAEWGVPLPQFSAPDALARVGLDTRFAATAENLVLDELKLAIDTTEIQGAIEARLAAPRQLKAALHGTRLDLDRYRTTAKDGPQTADAALLAPLAGPIAFLQGGNGTLDLDWDELTVDKLRLEALRLRVAFAGDDVQIHDLSTRTLGGTAAASAQLHGVTGQTPAATFKQRLTGISLAQVRQTLAPKLDLTGTLDLSLQGSARGGTSAELDRTLDARGSFGISAPHLDGVNIERAFCDLAALVDKADQRKDWPKGTAFKDIAGEFHLAGPRLVLERMTTGVGNLALRGEGTIDRGAQHYDILATARLGGERTSPDGCLVSSAHLRERDIPLHCQGSFGKDAATQCAPDKELVAQLVQDRVLQELRDKHGDSKKGKAVEGLLRGLLGDKKDRN